MSTTPGLRRQPGGHGATGAVPPTTGKRHWVLYVAHPHDPEYGMSAAVNRWTSEGQTRSSGLATSGEAGIQGMTPQEAGRAARGRARASAARVGVNEVEFWGFPTASCSTPRQLRAKITEAINRIAPDVVLSLFGGPEWAPGFPTSATIIGKFSAAVRDAYAALPEPGPHWLFERPTRHPCRRGEPCRYRRRCEALCRASCVSRSPRSGYPGRRAGVRPGSAHDAGARRLRRPTCRRVRVDQRLTSTTRYRLSGL